VAGQSRIGVYIRDRDTGVHTVVGMGLHCLLINSGFWGPRSQYLNRGKRGGEQNRLQAAPEPVSESVSVFGLRSSLRGRGTYKR
jgi:hypothetical protein